MTPPPAVRDDPLWQVGVSLMRGGSLCKVGVVEFPAGINSKLLFVIVTMLNTIHDTLMPAENCTEHIHKFFCSNGTGDVRLHSRTD